MDTASFKDGADDLSSRARPKIDEATQAPGRVGGQTMSFLQDHPATCLLAAAAVGYVVARIARNQR